MIVIKDLLFKLLDEIEPNELLEIRVNKQYNGIYLANKKSILPLALEMRYHHNEHAAELDNAYRSIFLQNEVSKYEQDFIAEHTVVLNEREYVVTEELLDIQYFDDYFAITIATPDGITTSYFKYSNISSIRVRHECSDYIVKQYNALNYKFKSNKN